MKLQDRGKLYNTESGFLQKFFVRTEDLGEGFTKYTTYRLYSRGFLPTCGEDSDQEGMHSV